MKHLPPLYSDRADFPLIRQERGFYVDKTPLFRQLLATRGDNVAGTLPALLRSHLFLARPRRFGKSLLVSTLETWFQGLPPGHLANPSKETGNWSDLPAGWTSPGWLWKGLDGSKWHGLHGWHPVIRLDMSAVATAPPLHIQDALRDYLMRQIVSWEARGIPWGTPGYWRPSNNAFPDSILSALIEALYRYYNSRPVVLVDEYDAPITEHVGTDTDPAPVVTALRGLYRALKDDQGLIYGVFMTGITRFAKTNLFSALNNMLDLSEDADYGALCGFTEAEVDRNLSPYIDWLHELDSGFQDRDVRREWREFYNGYRFSPSPSAPRVYNPFTLLRGLDQVTGNADHRSLAAEGQWPSPWSETGHPGLLMRLAADTEYALPPGGGQGDPGLRPTISSDHDLNRPNHVNLMLETGYYTWRGGENGQSAVHVFPNEEVAQSWIYDILGVWRYAPERDGSVVDELRAALEQGDVPRFRDVLERFCFGFAHENLSSEASCRILLQALFRLMQGFTQSEKSNWGGRSDHEIQLGDAVYVFEVKFNQSVNAAWKQLVDRGYGREHAAKVSTVVGVALAFRREKGKRPIIECRHGSIAASRTADD